MDNDIYAQSFRWVLTPEKHPDMVTMVKKLNVKLKHKTLYAELYEFMSSDTSAWIQDMLDNTADNLTLELVSGCGDTTSELRFKHVRLDDHLLKFDYAASDPLIHKVRFSYEEIEIVELS